MDNSLLLILGFSVLDEAAELAKNFRALFLAFFQFTNVSSAARPIKWDQRIG